MITATTVGYGDVQITTEGARGFARNLHHRVGLVACRCDSLVPLCSNRAAEAAAAPDETRVVRAVEGYRRSAAAGFSLLGITRCLFCWRKRLQKPKRFSSSRLARRKVSCCFGIRNDFLQLPLVTRDVTFAQLLCSNLPAPCHMGASLAVPPAAAAAGRLTTSTVLKHIAGLLTLWFGSLSCPALASYHLELISVWLVALKSQASSLWVGWVV